MGWCTEYGAPTHTICGQLAVGSGCGADDLAESASGDKNGPMNTVGWILVGVNAPLPPGLVPGPTDDAGSGSPVAWLIIIVSALAAIAAVVTLVIMKTKSANRGPYGYQVGPVAQQGSDLPPSAQSGPGYGFPPGQQYPGQQPPSAGPGQQYPGNPPA